MNKIIDDESLIVKGNILKLDNPERAVICQQVNCVGVKTHGLSTAIAEKYGSKYNPYASRRVVPKRNLATRETRPKLGSINVIQGSPTLVNFFAQYMYGSCNNQSYRKIKPYDDPNLIEGKKNDSPIDRIRYFKMCLNKLSELLLEENKQFDVVYFPFKIGCGQAGGEWSIYYNMIEDFNNMVKHRVLVKILKNE